DTVPVQVDGDRHRLGLVHVGTAAALHHSLDGQLYPRALGIADRRGRTPDVLGVHGDAQALVLVHERQRAWAALTADVGHHGAGRAERARHPHGPLHDQLAVL